MSRHHLPPLVAAISLATTLLSQQVVVQLVGTTNWELLSEPGILDVGDVNGDGFDDFVTASHARQRVIVCSGRTGATIWSFQQTPVEHFAESLGVGGDIDGDGYQEVLVGARDHRNAGGAIVGGIYVFSARSGALLRLHEGGGGAPLAYAGPIIGDVDADGYDDYMAFGSASSVVGRANLYSGRTGNFLNVWASVNDAPGGAAHVGDVNGDGFDDIAMSETGYVGPFDFRGAVAMYSGRDFSLLYRVYGDRPGHGLGLTGHTCGGVDLNSDGIPDFVASADTVYTTGINPGLVRAYSGLDGSILWSRIGQHGSSLMGRHLSIGDDWNGDGRGEVMAIDYFNNTAIQVLSGLDGSTIMQLTRPAPEGFGQPISMGGDADGDGIREVLAGSTGYGISPFTYPGAAYVLKVASGPAAFRRSVGAACPGSNGALPHVVVNSDPRLGTIATITLRGAIPTTSAFLLIGVPTSIAMGSLGAPGCALLADPIWISGAIPTNADAICRLPVPIPNVLSLAGLVLRAQWIVADAAANQLGLSGSNALHLMLGN